MHYVYYRLSGGDTTRTIPPLELDFSMGEDLTTSLGSALKQTQETTPKSALASSSGKGGKNKKVSGDRWVMVNCKK